MKKTAILFALTAMIGCNNASEKKEEASSTTTTTVDTATAAKPAETPPPPMDSAAQAKAMMDYMTPGEMHKWMASLNGKWDAQVITWWNGPDKKGDTSKATGENKMIMGGRYQQVNFKGMMNGMPFEGLGMMGFDNAKQKFVSTWMDNMGTGIMEMEGTYDAATKTMNMSGKMTDPATKKDVTSREVWTITDDKHQTMEMYGTPPGQKEMKMMEIHYTKK